VLDSVYRYPSWAIDDLIVRCDPHIVSYLALAYLKGDSAKAAKM
jgi:hypothetical protein